MLSFYSLKNIYIRQTKGLKWIRTGSGYVVVITHIQVSCFLSFLKYASPELEEEGRKRYEAQKMERLETKARIEEVVPPPSNPGDTASDGAPPHELMRGKQRHQSKRVMWMMATRNSFLRLTCFDVLV